ncbi:MAG: diguanylate cyclase [Spongiibacteraceae bacterium]
MLAKTKPAKIRVLIIDDSRLIRAAASKMFGDEFDVVLAVDGTDGWEKINNDPDIQVVFTDLVMPEMDGFELLKLIRTNNKVAISNLPVIVATGADNPEVAKQKAISLGATDFITKPFDGLAIQARALAYAKLHSTNKALRSQTTLDPLTGMMNSQGIQRQLVKDLAFVSRHGSSMTVMTLEVDSFKDLFIQVGRAGAEAIVKKIASVVGASVRKEDSIARTGVAMFTVIMPLAQGHNSLELADRICQTVESFRAKLDGKRMKITISVGVNVIDADNQPDAAAVLDAAELALTQAAAKGRSQIYQMTMKEYLSILAEREKETMSIDQLLLKIQEQRVTEVVPCLDVALYRLAPLLAMLSNEQKQRIITYR